jgi:hypothetical protein
MPLLAAHHPKDKSGHCETDHKAYECNRELSERGITTFATPNTDLQFVTQPKSVPPGPVTPVWPLPGRVDGKDHHAIDG